jgi:hypothetical protein
MRRAWLLCALVGCYQPVPPEGVPCTAARECPAPLQCDQGTCRAQPLDAATDGATDGAIDAALADVAIDVPPGCDPVVALGPFSVPVKNAELSSPAQDGTPTLTADRLEIFFKSSRPGGLGNHDIWRSKRTAIGLAWPAPTAVTELNAASDDTSPEVSGDGLTIWFSSDRAGGLGGRDLWVATRPNRTSTWSVPVSVPELSSTANDEGLTVQPSQLVAYFHSDRAPGPVAIYRATRTTVTSAWSMPVAVTGLPAANNENPWVTSDECTMYFGSDRAGGQGGFDLYLTRRPTPDGTFGVPTAITELNGTTVDADAWLTPDQRRIVFASDRPMGMGQFDLFEATR